MILLRVLWVTALLTFTSTALLFLSSSFNLPHTKYSSVFSGGTDSNDWDDNALNVTDFFENGTVSEESFIVHYFLVYENLNPGPESFLTFTECVNIRSVMKSLSPDAIFLHTNVPEFWPFDSCGDLITDWTVVKLVQISRKSDISGKNIFNIRRETDVRKMEVLRKYGGLTLDFDIFMTNGGKLRNLLDQYPCVTCAENESALNVGFLACKKNAAFLRKTLEDFELMNFRLHTGLGKRLKKSWSWLRTCSETAKSDLGMCDMPHLKTEVLKHNNWTDKIAYYAAVHDGSFNDKLREETNNTFRDLLNWLLRSAPDPHEVDTISDQMTTSNELTDYSDLTGGHYDASSHDGHPPTGMTSGYIHTAIMKQIESLIQVRLAKARKHRQRMEEDFISHGQHFQNQSYPLFVTLRVPRGGLGNYMFMIAALVGVARKNHRVPILMYPDHRNNYFEGLTLEVVNQTQLFGHNMMEEDVLGESGSAKYMYESANLSGTSFANRTVALQGYLQSWMYFDEFRDDIRAMFTFKEHILYEAKTAISIGLTNLANTTSALTNLTKPPTLIGIHVRRGDILEDPHKTHGQTPATDQYLLRTVLRYQKKYSPVIFVVISNDLQYCKGLFSEDNFIFVTDTMLQVDMAIMNLMDQNIMTVGSYSFWGAYLNSQATDVSYFKNWPRKNSSLANQTNAAEYFLPEWNARS